MGRPLPNAPQPLPPAPPPPLPAPPACSPSCRLRMLVASSTSINGLPSSLTRAAYWSTALTYGFRLRRPARAAAVGPAAFNSGSLIWPPTEEARSCCAPPGASSYASHVARLRSDCAQCPCDCTVSIVATRRAPCAARLRVLLSALRAPIWRARPQAVMCVMRAHGPGGQGRAARRNAMRALWVMLLAGSAVLCGGTVCEAAALLGPASYPSTAPLLGL